MSFSREKIDGLRARVEERLSPKRFSHTLGVARAAVRLSEFCAPELSSEAEAAALLHDITKELPTDEQMRIIESAGIALDDEDRASLEILHAFSAPTVIRRDFAEFATDGVISAVYNHTIGAPDMSVLDEIVFLADFIEDTRKHESCVRLRKRVWREMAEGDTEANIRLLHIACVDSINSTISHLEKNKKPINTKNILTKNALLSKI